jgi:phenylalanyl-tRNA synthetase beta chain
MNVSVEWLRSLVPFTQSAAELRDLVTMRAATVDEMLPLRPDLAPIVVARVVECARHPDSDRLSVTRVDAGTGELLDVVCGAPNVAAGKLYPFAAAGVTVPNGVLIQKRKIRGAVSNGMLCSAAELLLGEDQAGIMELDIEVPPGTPFLDAIPLGDARLVIDVGANRPDLLSHLGLAREVAAAVGAAVRLPEFEGAEVPAPSRADRSGTTAGVAVSIDDDSLARRYMAVVIRGVKVGPSPDWIVQRLAAVGSRSINNVVDATNFILLELGQPTHAFDLARLAGPEIHVRAARDGERLTTLDGAERALDSSITVIADARDPVAIAGVMGGADSEVTAATTDILLEVATFDPQRTRTGRRRLGVATDASYRFERGVDAMLPPLALERCARLITSIAGGAVADAPIDLLPAEARRDPVRLRVARASKLLGEQLTGDEIQRLLRSIGFEIDEATGETIGVVVPSWRSDVVGEVDLIEEVARLRGYETFSTELRPQLPSAVPDDPHWILATKLADALTSMGLHEVRPMPFVAGDDTTHVRVANPLAETEAHLRASVLESLAKRVEFNFAHMQGDVRLFEVGAAFAPGPGAMPREELRVAAVIAGRRRPAHFSEPEPPPFDEWDARALGERIARVAFPGHDVSTRPAAEAAALWDVIADGAPVGSISQLRLDAPVWASPTYGVEVVLDVVDSAPPAPPGESIRSGREQAPAAAARRRFRPLPVTPPAVFDLAFVVPDGLPAIDVENAIREVAGELLESVVLFDVYAGAGIADGARSIAWRLTLRHPDRTLRDREIEGRRAKIIASLERELDVRHRSA